MNEGGEASDFLAQLKALEAKGAQGYEELPTPTAEEVAPEPTEEVLPVTEPVVEAENLVEQFIAVPLLPPDAPSRMTPAAPEKPKKEKKTKVTPLKNVARYEYDIDRETVSATVEYLNARAVDGWRLIGFDGNGYVFEREVR